ncbi:structural protein [Xanthomonas phage XbC2]|nr:structural protein [Xanthomonas phage XbC2]
MLNFIKLYKLPIIIVAFILYSIILVSGGWKVHTYYDGYKESLDQKVEKIVDAGISKYQSAQAQGLEDQKGLLADAKTNTIIKEKTILQQPIYLQQCMDQAGVDLLKEYRQNSADIINGKKTK